MVKFYLSFLLVSCFLRLGAAQTKKQWVKKADHAFEITQDYSLAFTCYKMALNFKKDTSDVLRLLYRKAESARQFKDYNKAKSAYEELISRAPAGLLEKSPYCCTWAHLGDLHLTLANPGNGSINPEDYQRAAMYFNIYKDKSYGLTNICDEIVDQGRAMLEFIADSTRQLTNKFITVENVGPNINSQSSDFASRAWVSRLYFSSYRTKEYLKAFKSEKNFSRIYLSTNREQAETLQRINSRHPPDKQRHIAHSAFNRDRSRLYYTICEFESGTLNIRCDLYYHKLDSRGNPIGNPIEVSSLNNYTGSYTITQPAFGWDEVHGQEILYFVSDRPGTKGGMDIWKTKLVEGRFETPTNDLIVNTKGDEMTPFYKDGVLYFSSNSHHNRYGGFDIFSTPDPLNVLPTNLGQKINSGADELYYSLNENGSKAYFSSNRAAAIINGEGQHDPYQLSESCCLDIYTYSVSSQPQPCNLEVTTLSNCICPVGSNQHALQGATIGLYDITTGDNPGLKHKIEPSYFKGNMYKFTNALRSNHKYQIVGTMPGFEMQKKVLDFTNSRAPCQNESNKVELCFSCAEPLVKVQVYRNDVEVPDAKVRIIDIDNLTHDNGLVRRRGGPLESLSAKKILCSYGIAYYDTIAGEKEIEAFSEHQIEFEKTYLVLVSNNWDSLFGEPTLYKASRSDEAFCGISCRDSIRIDLESMPSVTLFFDNAKPVAGLDPDSSIQSYLEMLPEYQKRIDDFMKWFAINSEQNSTQRSELNLFFKNELPASEKSLIDFAQKATELLCQKTPITIEAAGCVSPRFSSAGNPREKAFARRLVNRRVNSVRQDLEKRGLNNERWGKLYQFKQVTKNCERNIRDSRVTIEQLEDQNDPKWSIYSIDAILARRLELSMKIQND